MQKVLLSLVAAAVTLALATNVASATTGIGWDDTSATLTVPNFGFSGALGIDISCTVVFDVTLHASIAKRAGALIGFVDASVTRCSEGNLGFLVGESRASTSGPHHLTYSSFSGTLPSISSITLLINDIALWLTFESLGCLTNGLVDLSGTTTGGTSADGLTISGTLPLQGVGLCPLSNVTMSGAGTFDEEVVITLLDGESPTAANLSASPSAVTIEALESSDTFTLRNSGGSTATIDSVSDGSATQFDVSGCGAGRTIAVSGSCVYTIEVDSRPLASGIVTITYDDGVGGTRRVVVEVDIAGVDNEAVLTAEPASVTISQSEQNDIVEIRNTGGGLSATIDRVTTTTSDSERPDFTVTTTGCRERLALNEACHYLISVNARPEASGRITVEYDDGAGGNRTLVIEVDIAGPDAGELESDPTSIVIERLESNDSFVIRNISPDTAIVVDRATVTSDDSGSPEFSVTGIGCPSIYVAGASCTYVVSVNSRPEADGRYTLEYDDGAGNNRTVVTEVDIAS